ncbi:hypothetical protein [Streptomyces sp. NPDC049555]|uniref:hypothetical protein n=1 Tax=Streptomyces sp. NPDC049555 TaxID=3154930 RepID=UPI00341A324E
MTFGPLATGGVGAAAAASADTNKNQQTSSISGPTASVLSAHRQGSNLQVGQQAMIKRHTVNDSLIDYIELPSAQAKAL